MRFERIFRGNRSPFMEYAHIRLLHITCAVTSVSLFMARGLLQLRGVQWRRWTWLRIAPHLNDTVLLAAAVALAWRSAQYPLAQPWLTAKVLALLAYVFLGRIALLPRTPPARRRAAFVLALICVGYILVVARTRALLPGTGT